MNPKKLIYDKNQLTVKDKYLSQTYNDNNDDMAIKSLVHVFAGKILIHLFRKKRITVK